MPHEYREISEVQKESYKLQLLRKPDEDFGSEFVRTTDLERKIVNEHGFGGVKLIFESRNSGNYFQSGEFPPDCPWAKLNGLNLVELIETDFQAIADKIPNLLAAMKERCRFVYAERDETAWKLHYFLDVALYDGREYFRVYTGGAPNPNAEPNEGLVKFGWTIPRDLAEFYAVHDGFGEIGDTLYVLNSSEIKVMGEMMNPICKDENLSVPENYRFDDLLEFFPDGAGNAQCFHRRNPDSSSALTVDWDHETWEISDESGFYEFIDERMSVPDEE